MNPEGDGPRLRYGIGQQVRHLLRLAPAVHTELAERVGVGITDLLALDHVTSAESELGVVQLAELLEIRSSSATVLVDRLVASGHLERLPHASDRRRISLHPTETAHRDVRSALAPLIEDIVDITDELSPSEAVVIVQFLTQVSAALERFVEDRGGTVSG